MSGSFINQLPTSGDAIDTIVLPGMPATAPQQPGNTFGITVGTGANQLAAANDSRIVGSAQKANNLSDLASASTGLSNLGGLAKSSNLSDVASASTALSNLGGAPSNSPTFTGNPSYSDSTHSASIHLSFPTIAALEAFNPTGVLGGVQVTASVAGYTTPGDLGGGTFDLISTSRTADSVVAFSVTGPSGYKWIRRYDLGALTFEMAGAIGDYSFSTDTGTDNAAAFNAFFAAFNQTAYAAGVIGNGGIRVHLRPGKSYLLRSVVTLCDYVEIVGTGYGAGHITGITGSQWFNAGSAIVLDVANGATRFACFGETKLENFAILRRGLPLAPTGLQCIGFYGTSGGSWNDGSVGISCDSSSTGLTHNGSNILLRRMLVIGFGTGCYTYSTAAHAYDCVFDCYNGVEATDVGDTIYRHRNKCLPLMGEAVPSGDPNLATCRAHAGIGFNYHDRCDTLDSMAEESENWSTGFNLSNLGTSAMITRPKIESNGNAGDIGINIINWVSQLRILDPYVANGQTPINVAAVQWNNATKAAWFNEGGNGQPSQVDIIGGNLISGLTGTAVFVVSGDYCHTRVTGPTVFTNASNLLNVAAKVAGRSGSPLIVLSDIALEQGSDGPMTVDATMAPYVFLDRIWDDNDAAFVAPTGNTMPRLGTTVGPTSGMWYGPVSTTTTTPVAGDLFAFPFEVGALAKIVNIGVNVTATTGGSLRFGIYADNGGVPGALLYDSGVVSVSATGGVSPSTAPSITPLTSPYVWLAVVAGATTTPTLTALVATGLAQSQGLLLGATTLAHAASNTWVAGYKSGSYSDTTVATALPSTFGAAQASGGTVPSIYVEF